MDLVRFGSLAAVHNSTIRMAAFGCKAAAQFGEHLNVCFVHLGVLQVVDCEAIARASDIALCVASVFLSVVEGCSKVRFGSLAAVDDSTIRMAAFGCKAAAQFG